ncbi:MAG: hypothetical protein D6812_05185, partial [Deltaproteobacteria bacterium]
PAGEWLETNARRLGVMEAPPPPILQGRDLIEVFGLKPGPHFGTILEAVYEAQLDGRVYDRSSALRVAREEIGRLQGKRGQEVEEPAGDAGEG